MLGALFGFRGRLSRPGFWEVLMSIVLIDIALVVGRMYVADSGLPGGFGPSSQLSQALLRAAPWVLVIFTLWSGLAAAIKRCHDRGRTGALVLVALIPVIGWLFLLIDLFFLEGTEHRNRYGRVPHGPDTTDAPERSRFDWDAEHVAPAEAEAAPAASHMMMDPEPAFEHHAPPVQVHEAPATDAPEHPVDMQEVPAEPHEVHDEPAEAHAEAPPLDEPPNVDEAETPALDHAGIEHAEEAHLEAAHAAYDPGSEAVAHEVVAEAPGPEPEPEREPELVEDRGHHAPVEDAYDPLEAPLVLNVR